MSLSLCFCPVSLFLAPSFSTLPSLLLAIPTFFLFAVSCDTTKCLGFAMRLFFLWRWKYIRVGMKPCMTMCKPHDMKSNKCHFSNTFFPLLFPPLFLLSLFLIRPRHIFLLSLPCFFPLSFHSLLIPFFIYFPLVYPSLHPFSFHARPISACHDMA